MHGSGAIPKVDYNNSTNNEGGEMKNRTEEASLKKTARIAGLWYLLLGITSGFSWMYISKIIVAGNAVLTANNIVASESLYLLSIISNVVGQISFIFLVLALYRLLKQVNETHARLMVTLVVVSVPIMFINILLQTGALMVLSGADYLKVFSADQLYSLALIFLNMYNHGVFIVGIFWGLWLFPFGYLVIRSGFLPGILGILLIISGFSYLIDSFTFLIIPSFHDVVSIFISAPEAFGELTAILWFLVKGIRGECSNNGGI